MTLLLHSMPLHFLTASASTRVRLSQRVVQLLADGASVAGQNFLKFTD